MATSSAQIMSEFNNPNIAVLISEEQIRDRIKELGAQITRDYEEKDYGGAGYSGRDLEGNEWSFGSYRPA